MVGNIIEQTISLVVVVRLLEVGRAALVSGKPPYSACLASKLTHVFVENALEKDVQALQSVGVKCLSPDYIPEFILQVRDKSFDAKTCPVSSTLLYQVRSCSMLIFE